jgi:hypothetical protein
MTAASGGENRCIAKYVILGLPSRPAQLTLNQSEIDENQGFVDHMAKHFQAVGGNATLVVIYFIERKSELSDIGGRQADPPAWLPSCIALAALLVGGNWLLPDACCYIQTQASKINRP